MNNVFFLTWVVEKMTPKTRVLVISLACQTNEQLIFLFFVLTFGLKIIYPRLGNDLSQSIPGKNKIITESTKNQPCSALNMCNFKFGSYIQEFRTHVRFGFFILADNWLMDELGTRSSSMYSTFSFDNLPHEKLRKNPMNYKCFKFYKWNKAENVHKGTINMDKSVSRVWKCLKYHGKVITLRNNPSLKKRRWRRKHQNPSCCVSFEQAQSLRFFITLPMLLPARNWHLKKLGVFLGDWQKVSGMFGSNSENFWFFW